MKDFREINLKHKNIAFTSDLHVSGQFEKTVEALQRQYGNPNTLDFFMVGDMTPFTPFGKWVEDPGYMTKKLVRKKLADSGMDPALIEKLAKTAQKDMWNCETETMKAYGLTSQEMSEASVKNIVNCVNNGILNPLLKIMGNSTAIISSDQKKALELEGSNKQTIEEMIKGVPDKIKVLEGVTYSDKNEIIVVTMPFSTDVKEQKEYLNQIKGIYNLNNKSHFASDVTRVLFAYHENRMPELVGNKGKPVAMKEVLDESVDILSETFPNARIYEIVGHNHVIPKQLTIDYGGKTEFIPVGIDLKTLKARTLIVSDDKMSKVDCYVK